MKHQQSSECCTCGQQMLLAFLSENDPKSDWSQGGLRPGQSQTNQSKDPENPAVDDLLNKITCIAFRFE
jgi:hypothetical protein